MGVDGRGGPSFLLFRQGRDFAAPAPGAIAPGPTGTGTGWTRSSVAGALASTAGTSRSGKHGGHLDLDRLGSLHDGQHLVGLRCRGGPTQNSINLYCK